MGKRITLEKNITPSHIRGLQKKAAQLDAEIEAAMGEVRDRVSKRSSNQILSPPRRVQIVKIDPSSTGYFKQGQFGYARARHASGGFHTMDDGVSRPGQVVYAVSKSKDGRGGAVWFTASGLRFTSR